MQQPSLAAVSNNITQTRWWWWLGVLRVVTSESGLWCIQARGGGCAVWPHDDVHNDVPRCITRCQWCWSMVVGFAGSRPKGILMGLENRVELIKLERVIHDTAGYNFLLCFVLVFAFLTILPEKLNFILFFIQTDEANPDTKHIYRLIYMMKGKSHKPRKSIISFLIRPLP